MELMKLNELHAKLLEIYGPQGKWWPGSSEEILVSAILTQNTNWVNVERAMDNIKRAWNENSKAHPSLLEFLYYLDDKQMAELIKPAGFYNVKTVRLRHLLSWLKTYRFDLTAIERKDTKALREELLNIKGVGKETADSILLYALERPVFVVDAYTKRLLNRIFNMKLESYEQIQNLFHLIYPANTQLYQELHGLIVEHAKLLCRTRPLCTRCLINSCWYRKKLQRE